MPQSFVFFIFSLKYSLFWNIIKNVKQNKIYGLSSSSGVKEIVRKALQFFLEKRENKRNTEHRGSEYITHRGGSRILLGGGALVYCSTSTPINHIVFFFFQNTSCIRKLQVISRGGVRTPCTLPLDPPLTHHLLKRLNRLTKNHNYLVRSGKL